MACPECVRYLQGNPHVVGACASVGIEAKRSTDEMVADHLRIYHDGGHLHCDVYRHADPVDGGPVWTGFPPRVVLTPSMKVPAGEAYDNGYTLITALHGPGDCSDHAPDPAERFRFRKLVD